MRLGIVGRRRDDNEKAIVEALRAAGCRVWHLSGPGCPDVLVEAPRGSGGPTWVPLEIKGRTGTHTPAQSAIPWRTVRDVGEAIDAVFSGMRP